MRKYVFLVIFLISIAISTILYNNSFEKKQKYFTTHKTHNATGKILLPYKNNRYLIQTQQGKILIQTKQSHSPGDYIRYVASLQKPSSSHSYEMRKKTKGILAELKADQTIQIPGDQRIFDKLRQSIRKRILSKYPIQDDAGLLLGILIGDTSLISNQTQQSFTDAGFVHILTVSGGNMVMMLILMQALLFFLPFYPRIIISGIGLIFYAILCGGEPSVIRSLIMAILGIIFTLRGREILKRRILLITFWSMLLQNPLMLLYDAGFQLSFGAVIGIFVATTKFQDQENFQSHTPSKFKKIFHTLYNNYVLPSLGASIGTLPILFIIGAKINIRSLFTNIFLLPFVPIISYGGIGSLFLPLSKLTSWIFYLQHRFLAGSRTIMEFMSRYGSYIELKNITRGYVLCAMMILRLIWWRLVTSTTSTPKDKKSLPNNGHDLDGILTQLHT